MQERRGISVVDRRVFRFEGIEREGKETRKRKRKKRRIRVESNSFFGYLVWEEEAKCLKNRYSYRIDPRKRIWRRLIYLNDREIAN